MLLNILYLLVFYLLIFTSISGFGLLFAKISGFGFKKLNFGYIGLYGLFFLTLISYITNLAFSHNYTHNLIVIIIGNIFFFYCFFNNSIKTNKFEFNLILFLLFLFFIGILIHKNHDDFPYYHFPYTYYLTQHSLNIGIGTFGHGFRTPSSIFYLNSLFYLPIIKFYTFNFGQFFILIFANIILLRNIFNDKLNYFENIKIKYNPIIFLSLLSLIFINIFFYRISEHGTDRSAQILIFLLIIELLKLYNFKLKLERQNVLNLTILIALIISLKSFYILYLILLLPIFVYIKKFSTSYYKNLKIIFANFFTICSICLVILVFLTFFFNTSCIIYPLDFTCFEQTSWSIPKNNVKAMNDWYELWSKAGATPNLRVENPSIYITGFNWVDGWIDRYFFNKVSDFLLGLLFIILIIFFLFRKDISFINLKNIDKYILTTFLIIFLLVCEWFYNHPALRYGGYTVIALIFFIPLSFLISIKKNNVYMIFKKVISLLIIVSIIFLSRNILRLNKEIKQYNYQPLSYTYYYLDDNHFRIDKKMNEIINNNDLCEANSESCMDLKRKIIKKFKKNIFIKNQ